MPLPGGREGLALCWDRLGRVCNGRRPDTTDGSCAGLGERSLEFPQVGGHSGKPALRIRIQIGSGSSGGRALGETSVADPDPDWIRIHSGQWVRRAKMTHKSRNFF